MRKMLQSVLFLLFVCCIHAQNQSNVTAIDVNIAKEQSPISNNCNEKGTIKNRTLSDPSQYGNIQIKRWFENRKAAFTFTFDDAMLSQYTHAYPILNQFGFRGTFYVNTGSVNDDMPAQWRNGIWPQFIEMSNAGNEIGSHSVTHPSLPKLNVGNINTENTMLYELYQSKIKIEVKTGQPCITLAYPYEDYNTTVINNTKLYYESARAGSNNPVNYTLSANQWYYFGSYAIVFGNPRSTTDDQNKLNTFYNYAQTAINQTKWGVLQIHDVVPFSEINSAIADGSWEPISTDWFTSACQFVSDHEQNGDFWVAPVRDIMKYMKERDNFSYSVTSVTTDKIEINVTDPLDNSIYNFPLTADIIVPSDWVTVIVSQGSNVDVTNSFISGTDNVIRTSIIVPDGGKVTLENSSPPVPVELVSFEASTNGKNVNLHWKTATEIDNYGFEIERKSTGQWEKIAFVQGHGNSNSPKEYSYTDKTITEVTKFQYRLKQLDSDGKFKYSNTVEVKVVPSEYVLYQNYPNPFNPVTRIKYQLPSDAKVTLKVYDILGAEVMSLVNEQKAAGMYEVDFNATNLQSGVYLYRLQTADFTEIRKMILVK